MKSKSDLIDFKKRLQELTSDEPDFWFLTPYQFNGKPFCGTYDSSTFHLTRNSFFRHVKWITIKGTYRPAFDGSTEIEYSVGMTKPAKILQVVMFCVTFIILNTVMLNNASKLVVYVVNIFWTFALIFGVIISLITTETVKERFKSEFRIVDQAG